MPERPDATTIAGPPLPFRRMIKMRPDESVTGRNYPPAKYESLEEIEIKRLHFQIKLRDIVIGVLLALKLLMLWVVFNV